jgi:hypothetical protein
MPKIKKNPYPELTKVAKEMAVRIAKEINEVAPTIESKMPYRQQFILEELIHELEWRV